MYTPSMANRMFLPWVRSSSRTAQAPPQPVHTAPVPTIHELRFCEMKPITFAMFLRKNTAHFERYLSGIFDKK